jgi:hypothetical protein
MSDLTISEAFANAAHEGRRAFLDSGPGVARVRLYAGPRPANGAPTSATLLLEVPLAKPSSSIAGGVMTLVPGEDPLVLATGVAAWARFTTADGSHAFDTDVGDMASTATVKLPSTQLFAGGTTRIVLAAFS